MKKLQLLARASLLISVFAASSLASESLLVRMDPSVADVVAKAHGLKIVKRVSDDGLYLVSAPTTSALAGLRTNALVQSAEKNSAVVLPELSSAYSKGGRKLPVTPHGNTQINMAGSPWHGYVNQPSNTLIQVAKAQNKFGTGSGVTVALIDTGVDYTHPVLAPVIDTARAKNFISGGKNASTSQETTPWVDQETTPWVDGSGIVVLNQETTPWVDQETTPWVDGSGKVPPAYGHGTMVAGIIHLVAPSARIMPLKVFDANGQGNMADVIDAINYAVKNGADVINMSFSADTSSNALKAAIDAATKAGVICVASVANDHSGAEVYPSNIQPVIGVGASDNNDVRADFSNYGDDVAVTAPGVGIYSTYPQNRYAAGWGTSFSTPYVTGTVALMRSLEKDSAGSVRSDLQADSDKVWFMNRWVKRLDVYTSASKAN